MNERFQSQIFIYNSHSVFQSGGAVSFSLQEVDLYTFDSQECVRIIEQAALETGYNVHSDPRVEICTQRGVGLGTCNVSNNTKYCNKFFDGTSNKRIDGSPGVKWLTLTTKACNIKVTSEYCLCS